VFSFPTSLFQHLILYGPRRREVPWRLVVFSLAVTKLRRPAGPLPPLPPLPSRLLRELEGFRIFRSWWSNLLLLGYPHIWWQGNFNLRGEWQWRHWGNGRRGRTKATPRGGAAFWVRVSCWVWSFDLHWLIAWTTRNPCLNGIKTFERRLELYRVRWFPCDCWGPPPLPLYKMPADERSPGRAGMGSMCGQPATVMSLPESIKGLSQK